MKKISNKTTAAAIVAAVVALISLSACKGRRADNVEPNGDTVEVVINSGSDSVSSPVIPLDSVEPEGKVRVL